MLATFPLTVKGLEALSPGFNFGNVILTLQNDIWSSFSLKKIDFNSSFCYAEVSSAVNIESSASVTQLKVLSL